MKTLEEHASKIQQAFTSLQCAGQANFEMPKNDYWAGNLAACACRYVETVKALKESGRRERRRALALPSRLAERKNERGDE